MISWSRGNKYKLNNDGPKIDPWGTPQEIKKKNWSSSIAVADRKQSNYFCSLFLFVTLRFSSGVKCRENIFCNDCVCMCVCISAVVCERSHAATQSHNHKVPKPRTHLQVRKYHSCYFTICCSVLVTFCRGKTICILEKKYSTLQTCYRDKLKEQL